MSQRDQQQLQQQQPQFDHQRHHQQSDQRHGQQPEAPPQHHAPRVPRPFPQIPPPEPDQGRTGGDGAKVTPDEVLTLGVLTLAGLWPGTWCGIAAIILRKVDWLAKRGAVGVPFRRCAQSLVDMLLRSPGDASLAVETWQQLASAQARLPDDLAQVLGLACSLLQRRTMESEDVRAKKKRRRAFSADTVATLSASPPQLALPYTLARVIMVSDIWREQEQEKYRERLATPPPPSTPRSPPHPQPPPPALPLPPLPPLPLPPQGASSRIHQHFSGAGIVHPPLLPPQLLPPAPGALHEYMPMPMGMAEHAHHADAWGGAAAGGGVPGVGYPLMMPQAGLPPQQRPIGDWNINGAYQGLQVSYAMPPQPPLLHLQLAAAARSGGGQGGGVAVLHAPPSGNESTAETRTSMP